LRTAVRLLEPLFAIPLAKLVLHLATFRGYGMFRDEFYYIACSKRLALGYVDQPPFSLLVLAIERMLLGESLFAVRLVPAVVGALTVLVVGLIARELGGGRYAQALSMTTVGLGFLSVFHKFSMNAFDVLVWALAALLVVRIVNGAPTRLWWLLGVLLGLGLQNKISVLWLGMGLLVGLVASGERRWMKTPWPWVAGVVAALIFLPHVLWQIANGWPTLEFIANATGNKMVEVAPLDFVRGQLGLLNRGATVIWLLGLAFLISRRGRKYSILVWIYFAVFVLLLLSASSRAGYLGPAYTWLIAAGGVYAEKLLPVDRGRFLRPVVLALVLLVSLLRLPFSLPVLPVESFIRYAEALGVAPSTEERKQLAELPQSYADMFGWEELVDEVAGVWETLSEDERDDALIFTYNYGNSGAIDYLGRERGLPPSLSGHNNYWLWGPGERSGETVIVVGGSREGHQRRFASVEHAATVRCRYCMPYENNKPIFVLRGPREPLAEIWPELKHYD
jgi:hypothetical protein